MVSFKVKWQGLLTHILHLLVIVLWITDNSYSSMVLCSCSEQCNTTCTHTEVTSTNFQLFFFQAYTSFTYINLLYSIGYCYSLLCYCLDKGVQITHNNPEMKQKLWWTLVLLTFCSFCMRFTDYIRCTKSIIMYMYVQVWCTLTLCTHNLAWPYHLYHPQIPELEYLIQRILQN